MVCVMFLKLNICERFRSFVRLVRMYQKFKRDDCLMYVIFIINFQVKLLCDFNFMRVENDMVLLNISEWCLRMGVTRIWET